MDFHVALSEVCKLSFPIKAEILSAFHSEIRSVNDKVHRLIRETVLYMLLETHCLRQKHRSIKYTAWHAKFISI